MRLFLFIRIIPKSAHAAFEKASEYFGIKAVFVDVDPISFAADVKAVRRACNCNTILVNKCPR